MAPLCYQKQRVMKKILIINGHPNASSFNHGLQRAFEEGARASGNIQLDAIDVGSLQFNPNLSKGYSSGVVMEPDLLAAQQKIREADHIVWIYPQWWGMMPAILKGFIDRVFVPGFAFKYRPGSNLWDKLLKGKTTEIICTIDYPVWYFKYFLGEGGIKVMRKMILDFCGLKTLGTTYIGPVRPSTDADRRQWLDRVQRLGSKRARSL